MRNPFRKKGDQNKTGIQEITPEEIRERAELNDTGAFPKFGSSEDFPDPDIVCVEIFGDEAVEMWTEAVERLVEARRTHLVNAMTHMAENLEIFEGAAHEEGQPVSDLSYDPFRYERVRT